MATISNNNIAQAIYLLSKDKAEAEQASLRKNVVQFLVRKRLLSHAGDIILKLGKIVNQENGTLVVHVSSAEKLTEKTKTHLAQILIKRYVAKEAVFVEKIDKNLLGGLRVEIDDEVIDLTLRNKMEKLQEYLTSNHE